LSKIGMPSAKEAADEFCPKPGGMEKFMKQRIARTLQSKKEAEMLQPKTRAKIGARLGVVSLLFSTLVFSLVASSAHAQLVEDNSDPSADADASALVTEVQPTEVTPTEVVTPANTAAVQPVTEPATVVPATVPATLRNRTALETRNVSLSSGMNPQTVPQVENASSAQNVQEQRIGQQPSTMPMALPSTGLTLSAPSTGVGGANPGNANTGGVQLQTVNVQANPAADSSQDLAVAPSRTDLLRRERVRRELENEGRLMERVEEARLGDEQERSKSIEGFSASSRDSSEAQASAIATAPAPIETVPVSAVGATASATVAAPIVADNETLDASGSNRARFRDSSESKFRLTPFTGYRWFENNNSEFRARNLFLVGVALEGSLNRYISIEGSFTYGRDQFSYGYYGANYGGYGYYGYSYQPYAGGYGGYIAARSRDSFEILGGAKVRLLSGSVRPFGIIGIGGILQRYNIDDGYTSAYLESIGLQRSTTHVVGNFGGGVDFVVADNMLIGGRFDYQPILNARYSEMHRIFGDAKSRYRLLGSLQLSF
jgi:hypothetical protein